MSFRRLGSRVRNFAERRRISDRQRKLKRLNSRQYLVQRLEDRTLLAGPELIAIRPDAGALLNPGDTLNVAPREFNLLFKGGANIDESTITSDSIKLIRSGGDGSFGDGNEIEVAPGYIGLVNPGSLAPSDLQRVVYRPASSASHNDNNPAVSFPDDTYQLQVIGIGSNPLTNLSGEAFSDGTMAVSTFRLDRGAQVVSVIPQPISGTPLSQASDEIVVYFDDQDLDPVQAVDPSYYRLVNTQASLSDGDDVITLPESVSYDSVERKVTLKFANDIPEGTYRLDIGQSGGDNSTMSTAIQVGTLTSGNQFQQTGFLGDLGGVSDNGADQDLYKMDLRVGANLTVTLNPSAAPLNLQARLLDSNGTQLDIANAGPGVATILNFVVATAGDYYVEVSSADGSTGSYQITAGVTGTPISASDSNSTFSTATSVGTLGATNLRITSSIRRQSIPLPPRPGSEDEPGHRVIQREQHIGATGTTPTLPSAVRTVRYYFPDTLGTDLSGVDYVNLITETEKQIVREIFEIYANLSGYEFIETSATAPFSDQLMIGKGDFRAVSPGLGPDDGVAGLANGSFAMVNGSIYDQANRFFGDGFTDVMFHEIGHSLGLGHSYDIPSNLGAGVPNDVLPGDYDVVHLQRIVPPNSTDIDMYRFSLDEPGRLTAQTIAERRGTPSLLDSALTLYRQTSNGGFELVARNDDYFGADAFIDLQLEPGTYFIGVTSTGNTDYDPNVPDSGFGGTTDGAYDLELNFEADRAGTLTDVDGTPMDGDLDGVPGGVYSFWFQSADTDTTIYVNKSTDTTAGPEGSGTLTDPFDTIDFALRQAGNRIVVPLDGASSIGVGEQFVIDDGFNQLTFRFGTLGTDPIDISGASTPEEVATIIRGAINNAITGGRLNNAVSVSLAGRVVQISGIDNLDITGSQTLLDTPNVVRITANGGEDGNIDTLDDNLPYLIGLDTSGNPLADGAEFLVPQGVNVMIQAGSLLKMRKANLDAGTSSALISRSQSSIQVLGRPGRSVFLRSVHNDNVGGDSDGVGPAPGSGDFGGIVFRDDSDLESAGIFLNYVNHADINNGGGKVFVDANELVFAPIDMADARPTVSFNLISNSDSVAIQASRDSFDDSLGRIGPDVDGNYLLNNRIDAMGIRTLDRQGLVSNKLTVSARLDDTDITHVLTDNLTIAGAAGGPLLTPGGQLVARPAARLHADPGLVLKFNASRIEAERGAGALIAEGTINRPVIFTSVADDRYGGSGSFDSDLSIVRSPAPGDWGGLYFGEGTSGSIDNAIIAYGGGSTPIEGGAANFNAIEVHQADLRITNSLLQDNAAGNSGGVRNGRGVNGSAVIYVRAAQPVIVDNTIVHNAGPAININANSLKFDSVKDPGRATGTAQRYPQLDDNAGPLVRLNELDDNTINGMLVRGELLTIESIWDDTDIVHVLNGEVTIQNHHTYSGLTLQSSNSESLIIKVTNGSAGFTATGDGAEIIDRIGGTLHVLGTVGHPVVMTSISDDSVGAGFTPDGRVAFNTNNSANPTSGSPGSWRGLLLDEFSNDRNVAIVRELENPLTFGSDINRTPAVSQRIGQLAPNEKSGDENKRLGFEVKGYISPTDPGDVDVYSFNGVAGTEIWIDIDRTDPNLDAVVEVINAAGTVLARSVRSGGNDPGNLNGLPLTKNSLLGGDHYTQNFRDPGFRYVLPGTAGQEGTYFIRVRSNPATAGSVTSLAGESSGAYRMQIRLQQVQEFPGSTVRFADIRNAQTGIDVRGLPAHSPLIGEAGELNGPSYAAAQPLINLLESDVAALGVSGSLSNDFDVDWYRFDLQQTGVQVIAGVNDSAGTIAVVLDIDYSDKAERGDTTIAVYDSNQRLIYVGRESDVADDQPSAPDGSVDDLSRGSLGKKDPYIGPIHLTPGQAYYVAVMSDRQIPSALAGVFQASPSNAANQLVRLEPVNSVERIVEDHIGYQGYSSRGAIIEPRTTGGLFDISTMTMVDQNVTPFTLQDVALYVGTDRPEDNTNFGNFDHLYTADPYESTRWLTRVSGNNGLIGGVNDIQDVQIRTDGRMYGYQRLNGDTNNAGGLVEINPGTGAVTPIGGDGIQGSNTPDAGAYPGNLVGNNGVARFRRADQFTLTDEVDALAFDRTGTTGPAAAPIPEYDIFYSVRESDTVSKLYRARQDGDARLDPDDPYGIRGYIQPAGTTMETHFLRVVQPVANAPANRTNIRVRSRIAGAAGAFTIEIDPNRPGNTNAVVNVNGNVITLTLGLNNNAAPNVSAIVDAINNHPVAGQMVSAVIYSGNANNLGDGSGGHQGIFVTDSVTVAGQDDPTFGALRGRVTGLSFSNFYGTGSLYGVTDAGEFLEINPNTAVVTNVVDAANTIGLQNLSFQGLTLGPQNVQNGAYANTLFAITDTGQLVSFDTDGNGFFAFESGDASQILRTASDSTGGFFTLTSDAGIGTRFTTDPISVGAPSTVTINETQDVRTIAPTGGTFTLSLADDVGGVTSLAADLVDGVVSSFQVQDLNDFPTVAPFIIQVENERMRVNTVDTFTNTLTVTRGYDGTVATNHPDTATVREITTTSLDASISSTVSTTLSTRLDNNIGTSMFDVADGSVFPPAPFMIRIQNEELWVTGVSGNRLTADRGQGATNSVHHNPGQTVQLVSDTLVVSDEIPLPSTPGFNIRINNEHMRVVNITGGNTYSVIRGANGTAIAPHTAGASVVEIETTAPIPNNATAFQIRAALAALPTVGGFANVNVANGPLTGQVISSPVSVSFTGALAGRNLQLLHTDASELIGDEVQEIALDPLVSNGTFQLEFNGDSTIDLPWNITAAQLQSELENLPSIGQDNVLVSGTNLGAGSLFVQFTGDLQDSDVNLLNAPAAQENLLQNQQQEIAITGNPTGGSFTLDINDAANGVTGSSSQIAFNADATAVANALTAISGITAADVLVTGTNLPGGPITIEFRGALAGATLAQFTATPTLTGGNTPTVTIATVRNTDAPGPIITEFSQGTAVSAPVTPAADGTLSVRDALLGLPQFSPGDITAAGVLAPPGSGVAITFGGAYAGQTVADLEVDNFLNSPFSPATITAQAAPGAGVPGSFIMDVTGLNISGADAIGLAFSPLDFNLWHPTSRRATDAGHGVNDASDDTRDTGNESISYDSPGSFRNFDRADGGISYHFGLEPWLQNQNSGSESYLRYLPGVNAQYGILNTDFHADLSSNPLINNGGLGSYNLPAGAYGSLTTASFDLSGSVDTDRPTLYFNYFLDTEGHNGSNVDSDVDDPFRDSARVFISDDGGLTWDLVASNNSRLSAADPNDGPGTAELPGFLSHLSDAGLNSLSQRPESQQIVQELMDNSGQWRQARVDLSSYAGRNNLMLRVDFSTAGSMNDDSLVRVDGEFDHAFPTDAAPFGEYVARGSDPRSIRSTNNQFQGFFIDDIIIGHAERGEMVTGASSDANITNLWAAGSRARDNDPDQFPDNNRGRYQLEIRRTDEHVVLTQVGPVVGSIFDTNDRHINDVQPTAVIDFEPATFVPDLTPMDTTVLGGFLASEIDPWSVTTTNPQTGSQSLESGPVATNRVSVFEATRAQLGSGQSDAGVIEFTYSVSSKLDTHGLRFFINGVPQNLVTDSGEEPIPDPTLASGELEFRTVRFSFGGGNPVFTWLYDFTDLSGPVGSNKAFVDNIQVLQGGTGLLADRNRDRAQGMLEIHSNFISDSSVRGINIQPGTTQAGGSVPHPGSTINFPQINTDRLVPGVVVENNVISGSSGIRFAGETTANPQRPVPFGRLVNNTLVGDNQSGTGIEIVGLASPTVLNNLITDFGRGIRDQGVNTVIRSNFFQSNAPGQNGDIGTDAITAPSTDPLFVDAARGNYYLLPGSRAIDSSQNTEIDRFDFVTFKTELGIPASPILAPERDVFGQLRIFSGESPGGSDSQIQKDRGAVDRSDTDAPYAVLLNPIDNDELGLDRDPTATVVSVTDPLLEEFTILLGDGRGPNAPFEGTGVNGLTVDDPSNPSIVQQAVTIEQNGVPLVQGVDYNVAYNELTGVLRLTPLSTLWQASSVYFITLDNTQIADRAGNLLRSNQDSGATQFTIIIPEVGTDFGDAPDSYRTLLASDGARHTGAEEALPKLGPNFDTEEDGTPSVDAEGDDTDGTNDDEDGIVVGSFVGNSVTEGLFLTDPSFNSTSDPGEVVAFLNRNDPAGAVLPIMVRGDGVLDAWIDMNGDGDFLDQGEYVIVHAAVTDGVNPIRVIAPQTATPGLTYARFRISNDGVNDPFGIAIGGEVEDYRINILDVDAPVLVDDTYDVQEDHVLVVDGSAPGLESVFDRGVDTLPTDEFVQPRMVIPGAPIAGTTDTYRTANGTVRIDDAAQGHFTYTPDPDFEGTDTFQYAVSTQRNEGPLFDSVATFATVTINVTSFNAPPTFDVPVEQEVFEDDPNTWLITNFFENVRGGDPAFGQDEGNQTVTFTIRELSAVPSDLMTADPDVTNAPDIEFFPAVDAAGMAVYEVTATDDGVPVASTTKTFTVHVRPVNDPPRFDPAVAGTSDINGPDEAWSVEEVIDPVSGLVTEAGITYTLREDLSQPVGTPVEPFFIPFRQDTGVVGYSPIGLLDVFTVGPANEADPLVAGGGQTLAIDSVPTSTLQGGLLVPGTNSLGQPGVFYTPPRDFNRLIGGVDSFFYSVTDDGTSWINGQLQSDPQTTLNVVEFVLNPVNDKPFFGINLPPADPNDPTGPFRPIETLEDSPQTAINSFAFSVEAGPPTSAFDETNVSTGQDTEFDIRLLGYTPAEAAALFTELPTISPEGRLTFRAAPDVFGRFEFELTLRDDGPTDASRGDQNVSDPQTITIDVLPVNDPPVVLPNAPDLFYPISEDESIVIPVRGTAMDPGLLDVFGVGPSNEADNIVPGGNQTLAMRLPLPVETALGGSISRVPADPNLPLTGLRYTPRANFVGLDTFTYTVTDDGVSVRFGTDRVPYADPRIASNTVSIRVDPVNNPPQFSGPANVLVQEDAGPVNFPAWAGNVLAGPPTALDELADQGLFFTINQISGDPSLFVSAPVAVIDPITNTASLQFESAADANGVAEFEVQLFDQPNDGTPQASSSLRTFTLTVEPVNDVPTFDVVTSQITVDEDSGPQAPDFATNISPGPDDESDQTVIFEVITPSNAESLFQTLPTVDSEGVLRFVPASNANGVANLTVTAVDSEGGRSNSVSVELTISPVNDRPTAFSDQVSTDEDVILTIDTAELLANDVDPDINNPFDVLTVVMPEFGFSLNGARVFYDADNDQITYDPTSAIALQSLAPNQTVVDSFTYRVVDSSDLQSNIVTVAVTVRGSNDAPVALPDNPTLNPNGPTIIPILANDADVDGTIVPGTIEITLQPAFGAIAIDSDGVVTFTAFQSFAVEDVFRYRVADNLGTYSQEALVTISANAAPLARDDSAGTYLGEAVVINVVGNDSDPDAVPGAPNGGLNLGSIRIVDGPGAGQAVPLGDGTIRYIPEAGFVGTDTFRYTIEDSAGRVSDPGTVQVRVSSSRLQNPDLRTDVNDDGRISPIDALLVINHIARTGQPSIPVEDSDLGPPFYDVNGDQLITPRDALEVINELARRQSFSGEGEQVGSVAAADVPMDFLDTIAQSLDDDDEEERLRALDSAFGDLM